MTWIQTMTGRRFDFVKMDVGSVDIRDVAHALSNICRFNGHTREFYSVAQHSVLASCLVGMDLEPAQRLVAAQEALLHDAHEAYVGDVTRPLKQKVKGYIDVEWPVQAVVRKALRLPEYPAEFVKHAVKHVDEMLLATEGRDLMGTTEDWELQAAPFMGFSIIPQAAPVARNQFIERYAYLFGHATVVPPEEVSYDIHPLLVVHKDPDGVPVKRV